MSLNLTPDNHEIVAILDASIQGSYHFVHDKFVPYVRVGPFSANQPITIRSGPRLRLHLHEGHIKRLQGLDATMDFAVVFEGRVICLVDRELFPMKPATATR